MVEALLSLAHSPRVQELVMAEDQSSYARTASLCLWDDGQLYLLKFVNPQPLAVLVEAFDCYEVRVIDRNATEAAQLEFGRYRIEFWDEDDPVGEVVADGFDYEVTHPTSPGAYEGPLEN